ncbi:hypothetical protein SCP_0705360 [Sparassis crispa]|uniref:Uncharacterized protein n=1 Tax=Sparassis crispa TaxID=139825 RepID=A0A401GT55_9APHY|nr:hypothetical protein SCP_0705360 [Sparassis crispa]GBE85349.1 hypothetical protein SCP_0705360 [Sparassis crispa]
MSALNRDLRSVGSFTPYYSGTSAVPNEDFVLFHGKDKPNRLVERFGHPADTPRQISWRRRCRNPFVRSCTDKCLQTQVVLQASSPRWTVFLRVCPKLHLDASVQLLFRNTDDEEGMRATE